MVFADLAVDALNKILDEAFASKLRPLPELPQIARQRYLALITGLSQQGKTSDWLRSWVATQFDREFGIAPAPTPVPVSIAVPAAVPATISAPILKEATAPTPIATPTTLTPATSSGDKLKWLLLAGAVVGGIVLFRKR